MLQIFLTSPMFDFQNTKSVVVRFPTILYWSIAGSITLLLIIWQRLLAHHEWIVNTITKVKIFAKIIVKIFDLIDLNSLKKSKLYIESERTVSEKEKLTMERKSESQLSGKPQTTEGQSLSNGEAARTTEPGNQHRKRQSERGRNSLLPVWEENSASAKEGGSGADDKVLSKVSTEISRTRE